MHRLASLALLLLACSSSPETTHGNADQMVLDLTGGSSPLSLLVVVDDGVESTGLRDSIDEVEVTKELSKITRWDDAQANPAIWFEVHVQAFVVRSSQPTLITGPFELNTVHLASLDVAAFSHVLVTELRRPSAGANANQLLAATRQAVQLLNGERSPTNTDESRIVAELPAITPDRYITLVSARDDASPSSPDDYRIHDDHKPASLGVVGEGGLGPRLSAWERTNGVLPPTPTTGLFSTFFVDGQCPSLLAKTDENGKALCRVTIAGGVPSCDPSRGWSDPIVHGTSQPSWIDRGWGPMRVCEVRQLEGDQLALCQRGEDPGASGYCVDARYCGIARFTERAFPAGIGRVHVTIACDLQH